MAPSGLASGLNELERSILPVLLIRLLLAGLLSVIAFTAIAQDAEQSNETESTSEITNTRPIEQIDVIGERTLLSMRNEIVREEDSLYKMFNDLNSDDKFDIFCKKKRSTASYIPRRSCEPLFLTRHRQQSSRFALSEMRQAFADGGINYAILGNAMDYLEPESEIRAQVDGEFEAMNEEIFRIAAEDPDYLSILQKLSQLKTDYQDARQARFKKD